MTENPFQLPGYQVIGMQDTGVAFDVHLQPPSPVACSSCGTIGDFVKNPKSRRKPSRKLFRNEFSNKNSVKLTDFFVDFNSVRMI